MERKVNTRLLLWTLGVLAVLAGSIHAVHLFQVHRNADSLLRQANAALDKGNIELALGYFDQYLKFRPDDYAAEARYGLTLEKIAQDSNDRLNALGHLDNVLRHDSRNKQVRFRLVHCLIHLQRLDEAIGHLKVLEEAGWAKKGEIEHMLGWCYEAKSHHSLGEEAARERELARDYFLKAAIRNPESLESYTLLAEVYRTMNDTDQANQAIERMIEKNPESFRAFLIRSRYALGQKNEAQAEKDLNRARELAPQDAMVLLAGADWAQGKGQVAEARKLLREGRELYPKNVALAKALAGLELRAGQRAEAMRVLEQGMREAPFAWDLVILFTDLLIDDGKLAEADQKIADLRRLGAPTPLVDYLQARRHIEQGQWTLALALLEQVRLDLGTHAEWGSRVQALLGLCYEMVGDTDQQLTSFRRAVELEPHWTAARFGLGNALAKAGRLEDALAELNAIAELPDAPSNVPLLLARSLILRNLRLADDRRDWLPVERTLELAQKKLGPLAELALLRAEVLAAQQRFPQAKEVLETAQKQDPEQVSFVCALADLEMRQKHWDPARAILDQAEKQLGDKVDLRLARCRLLAQRVDAEARKELLALGQNLTHFEPEARTKLLRELADTWNRLGEYRLAEDIWRQIAKDQPRDLRSRFLLLELALQTGQVETAKTFLNELRKLEGDQGTIWRYCYAAVQVADARGDKRRLESARHQVEDLIRQRGQKDWARLPHLLAKIHELEGHYDLALENYQKAFDLGELQPRMVFRLTQMYLERQRFEKAFGVVAKVEENGPLPRDLARLGAEAALGCQNKDRAVAWAEKAVASDSRDYRDALWLGRVYQDVGLSTQAEDVLRRGVEQAGHTPETWLGLIEQLARTGQHAPAEKVLADLRTKLKADLVPATLARAYDLLGQPDPAEANFLKALESKPNDFILLGQLAEFYRRNDQGHKAIPVWRKLLDPASAAPGETLARARRWLAIQLARTGNALDYQEAFDLLSENQKLRGESLADQRARALVLGVKADKRIQALELFERTHRQQPASPEELLVFAELLAQGEEVDQARKIVLELITNLPDQPQLLAFYVRRLIEDKDLADAALYLARLEKREPVSPRTRALQEALAKAK